ncbi:MAG: AmmeMemoRadiSam system protein B [Syntrophales bacterium]|nr:AmmeMemoRadiSam system protein B [Syntrophales bacterium]
MIRKAIYAGTWYPGNEERLRISIEKYLAAVPLQKLPGITKGILVPHAGYTYSGQVAAYGYAVVRYFSYDAIIVIAPSHYAFFHNVSVFTNGAYETPLGLLPVDEELAERLIVEGKCCVSLPEIHEREHAIEVQVPFLQLVFKGTPFVPLIMGDQSEELCKELAETIYRAISVSGKKVLIVASSDLSHFYGYDRAVKMDGALLKYISEMDDKGLLEALARGTVEACGGGPIATLIKVCKFCGSKKASILKYANSGDVTGDRGEVVGYAAAAFYV